MPAKTSATISADQLSAAFGAVRQLTDRWRMEYAPNEPDKQFDNWAAYAIAQSAMNSSHDGFEAALKKEIGIKFSEATAAPTIWDIWSYSTSIVSLQSSEKAFARNDISRGLLGLVVAASCAGALGKSGDAQNIRDLARKAANARHARGRVLKAEILRWYESNCGKYRSINAAAKAAEAMFPISRDTVRDYIREHKKSLGRARTS